MAKKKTNTKEVDEDVINVAEKWLSNAVSKGRFKGKRMSDDLSQANLYTSIDVKYQNILEGLIKIYKEENNKTEAKNKLSVMVELMINTHKQKLADPTLNSDTSNYEIEKLNEIKIYINALCKSSEKKNRSETLSIEDIALFIKTVNDMNLLKFGMHDDKSYCIAVRQKYNIDSFTDRNAEGIRIAFGKVKLEKKIQSSKLDKMKKTVLSNIDAETRGKIIKYLDGNNK